MSVFNDLRQFKTKGSPVAVDGRFNYGSIPKQPEGQRRSSTRGATSPMSAVPPAAASARYSAPVQASNTLMITKEMSATGRPLMVGGPADRLLLPRPRLRDRHAGSGAGLARIDLGARSPATC